MPNGYDLNSLSMNDKVMHSSTITKINKGKLVFTFWSHKQQRPEDIKWEILTEDIGLVLAPFLSEPQVELTAYNKEIDQNLYTVTYRVVSGAVQRGDRYYCLIGKKDIRIKLTGMMASLQKPIDRVADRWETIATANRMLQGRDYDVATSDPDQVTFEVKVSKNDIGHLLSLISANMTGYSIKRKK